MRKLWAAVGVTARGAGVDISAEEANDNPIAHAHKLASSEALLIDRRDVATNRRRASTTLIAELDDLLIRARALHAFSEEAIQRICHRPDQAIRGGQAYDPCTLR